MLYCKKYIGAKFLLGKYLKLLSSNLRKSLKLSLECLADWPICWFHRNEIIHEILMLTFPYQKLLASVALVNSSSLSLLPKRVKIIQIINHIGGLSFHSEAQPHPLSWISKFYDLQSFFWAPIGANCCPPPQTKFFFASLWQIPDYAPAFVIKIVKQRYLD